MKVQIYGNLCNSPQVLGVRAHKVFAYSSSYDKLKSLSFGNAILHVADGPRACFLANTD